MNFKMKGKFYIENKEDAGEDYYLKDTADVQ